MIFLGGEIKNWDNIHKLICEGDFDFYLTYGNLKIKNINCKIGNNVCTDYKIKYLQGINDADQVIQGGIDISSSSSFAISNNDIYSSYAKI